MPIPDSIDAAVKFVKFNSAVRGIFINENTRRIDVPDYDFFVIRELICRQLSLPQPQFQCDRAFIKTTV